MNLENFGVQEMDTKQMEVINGGSWIGDAWDAVTDAVSDAADAVGDFIDGIAEDIGEFLEDVVEKTGRY